MKRALIVAAIVSVLIICMGAVMAYRSIRRFYAYLPQAQEVPPQLKNASVLYGGTKLVKVSYLKTNSIGTITEIDEHADGTLTLIGKDGAANFGADLSAKNTISFNPCSDEVVAAPIGKGTYFCRARYPIGGPSLIDAKGDEVWTYNDPADKFGIEADDATVGDLGPAHMPEVAVGMNGDGGVRLLTQDGKEVWRKPDGNVWHIEIMPRSGASGNVIVHSNAAGKLTVRDENGNLLCVCDAEIYMSEFSPTTWGKSSLQDKILAATNQSLYVLSMDGKTLARLPAPEVVDQAGPKVKGLPVRLTSGAPYYAAIVRHELWTRTQLYVYDDANRMIYDEVLDGDCGTLAPLKKQDGTEDLLLGCDNSVMKYSLAGGTGKLSRD
jgi:hypothetical protein